MSANDLKDGRLDCGASRNGLALKAGAIAVSLAMAVSLVGCNGGAEESNGSGADGSSDSGLGQSGKAGFQGEFDLGSLDLGFTDRDADPSYDEASATKVLLSDSGVQVQGEGASVDGSTVTLSQAATYVVSGEVSNGSIVVNAGDDDKLQIVLAGATVHNEAGPALFIDNADKVFVTLADGTSNSLSDGESYELQGDDDNRDATVFSRADLTFNGSGLLSVVGSYKHAICSKDDLVITSGTFDVTSKKDAFTGKDCLKVADGTFTVNAGDDAFHSDAFLYMKDGDVDVQSCVEGYEGEQVIVDGGNHSIVSSDDAINAALSDSDSSSASTDAGSDVEADADAGADPKAGSGFDPGAKPDADSDAGPGANPSASFDPSVKPDAEPGSGASEDASVDGNAGKPADEGLPPDQPNSGEGSVGEEPPSNGGQPFAGQGEQMAQSSSSCVIQINGGTLLLVAGNDGIDSNGVVEINGGTVLVSGPDNGFDGSLDYDMSATINGGTVLMTGSVGSTEGLDSSAQSVAYGSASGTKGQEVSLLDSAGNVLATLTAGFDFSTVLASSPQISEGDQFAVKVGESNIELTMGEIVSGNQMGAGSFENAGPDRRG